MFTLRTRCALLACAGGLLLAGCAGCSGAHHGRRAASVVAAASSAPGVTSSDGGAVSGPASSGPAQTSATQPPATSSAPARTAPPATSSAPTARSTPAACGNADLAISVGDRQGAAGTASFALRFRNLSARTCTLYGYPGLDALGPAGQALLSAARQAGVTPERTVTLAPNALASALVEWANLSGAGQCAYSNSIAVTAPNTTRTVRLNDAVSVCRLEIRPVVPGATGELG